MSHPAPASYVIFLDNFACSAEAYIQDNYPEMATWFDWSSIFELLLEVVQGYTLRREACKQELGRMFTDSGCSTLATETAVDDLVDMLQDTCRVVTKELLHHSNFRMRWDGNLTLYITEVIY